jgi:hypothetical protein
MALRKPRWRHPDLQPGWIDRPHQVLTLGEFAARVAMLLRSRHFLTEPKGRLTFDQTLAARRKRISEETHDEIAERG